MKQARKRTKTRTEKSSKRSSRASQSDRRSRIDAIVMHDADGEKIFTLQGADHPYRVLVESINEGVATLDTAGNVLYANKRFAEILNSSIEEIVKSPLQNNLPGAQAEKLRKLIAQGLRRNAELELTLDTEAGRPRLVRFTLRPLRNTPQHRICVIATELTELVEVNEALKSNEESLRQLSARLLQLQDEERRHIARDLHDVTGQKLAFQCMALSGIQNRYSDKLDAESQQALSDSLLLNKEVSAEIRTLSYLLHPPLLDELGLSSAARWYAAGFTKRTGIPVDIDVPQEIKRLSPDAEVAIFRVLQESLTNVHRYANTSRARLRISSTDEQIKLEIEDFGKGMEPLKSKSSRESFQPLGVGIRGMTERIRQLGGRLEIVSRPKRGTLVTATIPLFNSQVSIGAPSPSIAGKPTSYIRGESATAVHEGYRQRIFIADDHEMIRRGIRNTLQSETDLEICGEAIEGQETVDKVKELHPDLVILDINMPVLNGLVAVRQILRHSPGTKIVIFSVHDSDQTRQECLAAGAHGFVSKGKEGQDLLRVVRNVLRGNGRSVAVASSVN